VGNGPYGTILSPDRPPSRFRDIRGLSSFGVARLPRGGHGSVPQLPSVSIKVETNPVFTVLTPALPAN